MAMERLDKLLASTGRWSRKEVKELIARGRVLVDGRPAGRPEDKCESQSACIQVDGEIVEICVANGQVVDYGSPLFRIRER